MKKIGITGGIGSGKSFVCRRLAERGLPVYSCDDEAKRLMVESGEIRQHLTELVGPDAYDGNQLNRPAVAKFLFANPDHAARINQIVHPVVKADFARWAEQQTVDVVVQECALLFETGFETTVDYTVAVYAPRELRLARAMERDSSTADQIEARMAQQLDGEEVRRRADFCILNDGTSDIDSQIDSLLACILHRIP